MSDVNNFLTSDDAIYHYTSMSTVVEHILPNMTLKFGDFQKANDPHEYRVKTMSGLVTGPDYNYDNSDSWAKLIQSFGFISFCENISTVHKQVLGYQKPSMWSHYGENHKGVCLVFSKKELIRSTKTECGVWDVIGRKVRYRTNLELPQIVITEENNPEKEYLERHYKAIFFEKHMDYSYENEFRVIKYNGIEEYYPIKDSLKCIILGDRFPDAYGKLFVQYANMGISVCKIQWWTNDFWLMPEYHTAYIDDSLQTNA